MVSYPSLKGINHPFKLDGVDFAVVGEDFPAIVRTGANGQGLEGPKVISTGHGRTGDGKESVAGIMTSIQPYASSSLKV